MTSPSTPAAPNQHPPAPKSKWTRRLWPVLTVLLLAGLAYQSYVVRDVQTTLMSAREAIEQAHLDTEQARKDVAEEHRRVRQLEEVLDEIRPLVPPTNDKLFTILSKGIGVTEEVLLSSTVSTTPAAAFAVDLTTSQQSDAFTQEVMIQDTHATQNLCVKPIAWATAGASCTLKCAGVAASLTCSGASTDGWRLAAGQSLQKRYDGTDCICVVGSGAGTNFQSWRIVRRRPKRRPLPRRTLRIVRA